MNETQLVPSNLTGLAPAMAGSSIVKGLNNVARQQYISENLKRAVDWKIFELTSALIDEDVDGLDFEESIQWFQPKHAEEVIEERTTEGLCGYPLCSKPLPKSKLNKARYRIDYKEKKIYEIDKSIFYCSVDCLEKCEIWMKHLDMTLPYGRPVVKQLNLENHKKVTIDDVLDLLEVQTCDPPVVPIIPAAVKSNTDKPANPTNKLNAGTVPLPPPPPSLYQEEADAPPLYQHPLLDEHGAVKNVDFIHGTPVVKKSDNPTPAPKSKPTIVRVDAPSVTSNVASSASTATVASVSTHSLPKSYIPKKVTGHPSKPAQSLDTIKEDENKNNIKPPENNEHEELVDKQEEEEYLKQYHLSSSSPPPKTKQTEISATIDEMVRTMKELQIKHHLVPKKKETTEVKQKNSLNLTGDLWQKEASRSKDQENSDSSPHLVPQASVASPLKTSSTGHEINTTSSPLLLHNDEVSPTGGSIKGTASTRKKSVEWNLPDNIKHSPPNSSSAPNLATFSKDDLLSRSKSQGEAVATKLVPKNKAGRGAILGLEVKERSEAIPLSAKAILTKKEPTVTVGTKSIFHSDSALTSDEAQFYSQHIEGHYFQQSSK
eukprot:gene10855-11832_t